MQSDCWRIQRDIRNIMHSVEFAFILHAFIYLGIPPYFYVKLLQYISLISKKNNLYNDYIFLQLLSFIKYIFTCLQQLFYVAAEVMFRQSDYTVFESNLPVQFELLLQPDPMPSGDITVQIVTINSSATGMYIHI